MSEQPSFKPLEQRGWSERAAGYDEYTARITSFGIPPLFDATDIQLDQRALDVCCGTGLACATAADRGASMVGVDISRDMVMIAAAKSMDATFSGRRRRSAAVRRCVLRSRHLQFRSLPPR